MVVNLCPEGENVVIERLGRFHKVQGPGWFFATPLLDRLRYVVDMRERSLDVDSTMLTKDNMNVHASGAVFMAFVDARQAAYGSSNPLQAVRHQAQLALRAAIGERALDDLLRDRAELNDVVATSLREPAASWGLDVRSFAISDISPESNIAAELRERAETEGAADAARARTEADNEAALRRAEADAARIGYEASAAADALAVHANAEAAATRVRAAAAADAIATLAAVLETPSQRAAARFILAQDHLHQSRHNLKPTNPDLTPIIDWAVPDDQSEKSDDASTADTASRDA